MAEGIAGVLPDVTVSVEANELPQVFCAATLIEPPVEPAVAVIDVPVELPVQPCGSDHTYDVALPTAAML